MDHSTAPTRRRAFLGATLFCVVMGAADEWHQQYIPGRAAEVADWVADSIGGLVGATTWMLRSRHKDARLA
jgi:VanZ family protein